MKKVLGIIGFCVCLTLVQISCGETPTAQPEQASTEKKCCEKSDSAKCNHHSTENATTAAHNHKAGEGKACCANKAEKGCCATDSSKTFADDSTTCASMKAKCNSECGTDAKMCASHETECKAKCAAKMDSTQANHCLPNCEQPCCSGDTKSACGPTCETECCAKL